MLNFLIDHAELSILPAAAQRRLGCVVRGQTYEDNSVFNTDCRHQCSCQNGTVACANLCARELTRPSGQCINARLVRLAPGKLEQDHLDGSLPPGNVVLRSPR